MLRWLLRCVPVRCCGGGLSLLPVCVFVRSSRFKVVLFLPSSCCLCVSTVQYTDLKRVCVQSYGNSVSRSVEVRAAFTAARNGQAITLDCRGQPAYEAGMLLAWMLFTPDDAQRLLGTLNAPGVAEPDFTGVRLRVTLPDPIRDSVLALLCKMLARTRKARISLSAAAAEFQQLCDRVSAASRRASSIRLRGSSPTAHEVVISNEIARVVLKELAQRSGHFVEGVAFRRNATVLSGTAIAAAGTITVVSVAAVKHILPWTAVKAASIGILATSTLLLGCVCKRHVVRLLREVALLCSWFGPQVTFVLLSLVVGLLRVYAAAVLLCSYHWCGLDRAGWRVHRRRHHLLLLEAQCLEDGRRAGQGCNAAR